LNKRSRIISLLLAALFFAALTAPVIAQTEDTGVPPLDRRTERFSHTIQYNIGGRITIDRQLGHACTTGAVKRQSVRGFGEMVKSESVRIAPNIITVDEVTDWTTAEDAVRNLAVTTTIELCNRAMSTASQVYDLNGYELNPGDVLHTYNPFVVDGTIPTARATDQVWAVSIDVDPGEIGSLHADFIAAYGPGPYEEIFGAIDPDGETFYYDEDFMWKYDPGVRFSERDSRVRGYERGDYYVGNYFEIDQFAYTSGGEFSRYISMSTPFGGAFLEEELDVVGTASVRDSFEMPNLIGGPKAVTLAWYELF